MPEDSGDKPIAIREGVDILPPNVTPLKRGAEPSNPKRRRLIKIVASGLGLTALAGLVKGANTETGQKILAAAPRPFQPTPDTRPPLPQQQQEVDKNITSQQNSGKGPENYDAYTLEQMARIKAENAASSPVPSPSPTDKK